MQLRWMIAGVALLAGVAGQGQAQQQPPAAYPVYNASYTQVTSAPSGQTNTAEGDRFELLVKGLTNEALTVAAKLCQSGRYQEAEFLLHKVLALDPTNDPAEQALALIRRHTGQTSYPQTQSQPLPPPVVQTSSTQTSAQVCPNGVCPQMPTTPAVNQFAYQYVGQAKTTQGPIQPVSLNEGNYCCNGQCPCVCMATNTCSCAANCICTTNCKCGANCACATNCKCGENCPCKTGCKCGAGCKCRPQTGSVFHGGFHKVIASMPHGIPVCTVTADGRVVIGKPAVHVPHHTAQTQIFVITVPAGDTQAVHHLKQALQHYHNPHQGAGQRLQTVEFITAQPQANGQMHFTHHKLNLSAHSQVQCPVTGYAVAKPAVFAVPHANTGHFGAAKGFAFRVVTPSPMPQQAISTGQIIYLEPQD